MSVRREAGSSGADRSPGRSRSSAVREGRGRGSPSSRAMPVEAQRREMRGDGGARRAAADDAAEAQRRIGHQHVVEDGQVLDEGHFLKRGLNAERVGGPRRVDSDGAAENFDGAGVGRDQPAQAASRWWICRRRSRRASAWTLPAPMAKETSSTATVAPNAFRSSRVSIATGMLVLRQVESPPTECRRKSGPDCRVRRQPYRRRRRGLIVRAGRRERRSGRLPAWSRE